LIKFRTKANFSWTGSTLFELYIVLCLLLLINIAWHLCVGRYLDCNVFFLTHQFFRFFIWDSVANFKMIWMNEIFWLSFKRTQHYGTHESILIRILFIKTGSWILFVSNFLKITIFWSLEIQEKSLIYDFSSRILNNKYSQPLSRINLLKNFHIFSITIASVFQLKKPTSWFMIDQLKWIN
jgi:hypothetical protein